jgi:3-methylfumaryl-CoA hydratase
VKGDRIVLENGFLDNGLETAGVIPLLPRRTRASVTVHIERLREWIGRTETSVDQVTAGPMAALSATFDRDEPRPPVGTLLPLLWHWLYFLPMHRQSDLGEDGHARLGGFLPPVPLPRRMYAGGRVDLLGSLRVGDLITRLSHIDDVSLKEGRTGPLVFVKVRHQISAQGRLALIESQDLVYREAPQPDTPVVGGHAPRVELAPPDARWTREIHPEEVLLFRYSALTFNGHRIHYDRAFAESQGYGGLVVHGPLLATLLADLVSRNMPALQISTFSFRAVAPLFDTGPVWLCGRPSADGRQARLWAKGPGESLAMEATATFGEA